MVAYFRPATDEEIKKLLGKKNKQEKFMDSKEAISIDKTFDIIHFTLTGRNTSDGAGIMSLDPFGVHNLEADFGYGPAAYLTAEELKTVVEHLSRITVQKFEMFVDSRELIDNKVYPVKGGDTDQELVKYAGSHYQVMRDAFIKAAEAGQGMIFWIK